MDSSSSPPSQQQQQQQYCLRWNNHQSNLLRVFSRLLDSEQFTDVVLSAAGGAPIRAHRIVLSACSSYFETLLASVDPGGGGQVFVVVLKDVSFADASAIVEFMYRGEVNVAQEQLPSLLQLAESLKVKGLADVPNVSSAKTKTANPAPPLPPLPPPHRTSTRPVQSSSRTSPASKRPHDLGTGETVVKRKRGRPRLLDSPGDDPDYCFSSVAPPPPLPPSSSSSSSSSSSTSRPEPVSSSSSDVKLELPSPLPSLTLPLPPLPPFLGGAESGPLTVDRLPELGIVKMNEYLARGNGTRQQYWEEPFVKVIMQVKTKVFFLF